MERQYGSRPGEVGMVGASNKPHRASGVLLAGTERRPTCGGYRCPRGEATDLWPNPWNRVTALSPLHAMPLQGSAWSTENVDVGRLAIVLLLLPTGALAQSRKLMALLFGNKDYI